MSALAGKPARALLFDFGGTLDADGVTWKERFFRIWREEVGDVSRDEFDPAFYAASDALVGTVPPSLTLSATVDLLARGVARGVAGADEEADGPSSLESRASRVAARFTREALGVLAARRALLARLSESYRLGIVSNFYGNLAAVCAESGIAPHFSAAIDSTVVGVTKPDAGIFRAALEALDVSAEETVVIGDSVPRDMAGARAVGMRHVLLREPGAAISSPCCPGDRVIGRLSEIEEVLA